MNQLLLAHLDPRAWRSQPAKKNCGEGRSLAGIFSHLHNNRLVWLKNSAPHLKCPARLYPDRCTIKQARAAHQKSAIQCLKMLKEVLSTRTPKRVTKFSRGSWAPTWPAEATMFSYMFAHEAARLGRLRHMAVGEALEGLWNCDPSALTRLN